MDGTGVDVLEATVESISHRDQFVITDKGDLAALGSHPWLDHNDSGSVIDYHFSRARRESDVGVSTV